GGCGRAVVDAGQAVIEQAEQQDQASEGGGSEAASVPRGRAVPDSGAFPFGRSPLGRPDLRAGLKVPNVNWPGVGALVSPIHSPFVQRTLQYYRDIYQDWQDSGLTWFEAMFVPWPLPDKLRNTYLDLVDDGTDWANDIYKDHVRDLPGIRDARWAAHQANDAVEFADFFIAPLDRAFGPTVPGLAWNIVKDSVNETTEILDDPKGWWDGASGLDQAGVVVSVVPGVGLVGKGVAKGIKHGFKSVVNDSDLVRRLTDDRGSVPVDFGFGKGRPKPGDYPEWIDYSRKPSSAHPLPEDFEPGWAATTPGGERGMDYQEQVTGIERLPDGRVPEYIMRDPTNGHPVAFDGHVDASRAMPEKFTDAKDGYTSLVTDPGTPWADGMETTLLDEAKRQTRTVPDGAVLEWQVSDPDSAAAIRDILDDEGYTNIVVEYVPKKG
ncbi:hypothetical protein, partial [Janibacter anophelis]|uniref:hypothetical protein n=1 Tax=Janibacter anophelis TaxID=319054 RepID=UPI0019633248